MKVIHVMTANPLTVGPSDTMQRVEEIMHEHDIRQLPVIDGNKLVWIITDRDIRSFLGLRSLGTRASQARATGTTVELVMTTNPVTLSLDDDLRDAVELLIEEKIGGIPVMDAEERLVGIATYVDVLRYLPDRLDEETW